MKKILLMMCLSILIVFSIHAEEPYTKFEYNGIVVIDGLKFAVTLPEDGKGEALLMGVDDETSNARVATRGIMSPELALALQLKFKESDVTRVSGGRPILPPNTGWIMEARQRVIRASGGESGVPTRSNVDPDKEYTCELKVIGYSALQGTEITKLTIPEGVTTIWGSAFDGCSSLQEVTLPSTLLFLGFRAFAGCSSLTEISIPNSVTEIQPGAFMNCKGLVKVDLPTGLTEISKYMFNHCENLQTVTGGEAVTKIDQHAFECCYKLADYTLPSALDSICERAFLYCQQLTTVTIPRTLRGFGASAFAGCSKLKGLTFESGSLLKEINDEVFETTSIESVIIPDGVEKLGYMAFAYSGLNSVTLPANLVEIGDSAFHETKLASLVIPDAVTTISTGAFDSCELTSVTFGSDSKLKTIGDNAFLGNGFSTIDLPDGVTSIGSEAFNACYEMESITLPKSLASLGANVFDYTLKSVTAPMTVPFDLNVSPFSKTTYSKGTLYIPKGTKSLYQAAEGWKNFVNMVEMGNGEEGDIKDGDTFTAYSAEGILMTFTIISTEAKTCQVGDGLEPAISVYTTGKVTIPSSVTISDESFAVVAINDVAFFNCNAMTEVILPNSLVEIKEDAFSGCIFSSIIIPDNVRTVGADAFANCKNLSSLQLGESMESIGSMAFLQCKLESLRLPGKMKSIGESAFFNCPLTSITSEISSPFAITDDAFGRTAPDDVFSICTLYVPSGTKEKYLATSGWKNFKNIVEMGSEPTQEYKTGDVITSKSVEGVEVKYIVDNAESKTLRLYSNDSQDTPCIDPEYAGAVTIPEQVNGYTVTLVSWKSFYGCTKVTEINLPQSVSEIRGYSFRYCYALERVNLPNSLKKIGDTSFANCTSLEKIEIPASVESIDYMAFSGSKALKTIVSLIEKPFSINDNVFSSDTYENATLYVPVGTKSLYEQADGWKNFKKIVEGTPGSGEVTGETEPYVVYNDGTLTFYCDNQRDSRQGTTYDLNEAEQAPGWSENANNITAVVFDASFANARPKSTYYWFRDAKSLSNIVDIKYLNTGNVTNMRYMFYNCSSLTNLDVSNFNTSNVTDMSWMFYRCSGLTSLDVSGFKTNNVTNIGGMFGYCKGLESLDLSNFNTSNVTDMNGMFLGCSGLTSLDVSKFNTSNVTDMSAMFYNCSGLTSLDVSNLNTSNVTSMESMFLGCSGLTSLDVGNFNTGNVTSMLQMFYGCRGLTSLDVSNFNTCNVTSMRSMFLGCRGLTSLDVGNFNTNNVTTMGYMFNGCSGLTSLDVSNFNTNNVTEMSSMFHDCTGLTSLDVSKFNTENAVTMGNMFRGCEKLTSLDLSSFSTKSAKDCVYETWTNYGVDGMLNGCSSLSEVTFGSNFATDENLSCAEVFAGCNSLGKVIYTGDIPASIHPTFFNGVGSENVYAALNVPEEYLDNYAAKFDGGLFYGGYFTLFGSESSELKDGDVFTAKTVEGVEMTFMVVSAKDKTCQVGDGKNACIDTSTSGSLTIPAEINGLKVNSIASWALYRCSSLSEIVISEGIESLMGNSIEQCNSVTSFVLPSSVTSLSQAFGGISSNLKSIKVADGNPVYDSRDNCNAIIETATNTLRCGCSATVIPLSVTAIGDWSMSSKNLTSVSIPNSVTYIGEGALRYNYFKSVVIPASVSTIAGSAFSTSYKLEDVTILSKNCTISGSAFGSCSKLKKVVSHIETPEAARGAIFYNSYDSSTKKYLLNDDVVLYVPKGTKEVYEQTDGWKNFTHIVEGIPATGDVTGEGEVNTEDVIAIAKMILSGEYIAEADVNGDGVVNVADIIEIINLMNASQTTE